MSVKYKVTNGSTVLGNFPADSVETAVDKAVEKWERYGNIDFSKPFQVVRGKHSYVVERG